jgi:voltage-gated potassium channel Kch
VVTLSMATTPFLMMLTRGLRDGAAQSREERDGPSADGASAIIVGYGRFGQTVAQILHAAKVQVSTVDTDVEMIDVAKRFGAEVHFGDGTRIDLLRQAGGDEAEVIAFCIDGEAVDAALVDAVHEAFPKASILVRAYDRRAAMALAGTPAVVVVREVQESAVRLASGALEQLSVSREEIGRAVNHYRTLDEKRLALQVESGDLRVARNLILTGKDDPEMEPR